MDWNHYNGPQMTPEQIHAYLDRIACPGPIPLNLAGLTRLLQAHQQAVPFENLDVLAGRPLSLDHEALFDKIVRRRQGGLCAELNTCFNWLLYSLGFSVFSYHARICNPPTILFRRHRVLGVVLPEGCYTVDGGFTLENARCPLRLEADLVQSDGACQYRYRRDPFYGWLQQQRLPGGPWTDVLGFTQEPPSGPGLCPHPLLLRPQPVLQHEPVCPGLPLHPPRHFGHPPPRPPGGSPRAGGVRPAPLSPGGGGSHPKGVSPGPHGDFFDAVIASPFPHPGGRGFGFPDRSPPLSDNRHLPPSVHCPPSPFLLS